MEQNIIFLLSSCYCRTKYKILSSSLLFSPQATSLPFPLWMKQLKFFHYWLFSRSLIVPHPPLWFQRIFAIEISQTSFTNVMRSLVHCSPLTYFPLKILPWSWYLLRCLISCALKLFASFRPEITWKNANYAQIWEYLWDDFDLTQRLSNLDIKFKIVEVKLHSIFFHICFGCSILLFEPAITLQKDSVFFQNVQARSVFLVWTW